MKRRRALHDLESDIRDHIERETQENIERGMKPEDARAAALRKFGNVARVMEDTRAVWHWVWLEQFLQDVRMGARALRRNPGFAVVVILTLALGIGLNTAVFSVVNAVLIRPLPYPHPERLVWLANYNRVMQNEMVSGIDFLDWKAQASSFDAMVAYGYNDQALITGDVNERHRIAEVTDSFWSLSGARPAMGKLFGAGEENVLVISDRLFEQRFGRNPRAIGTTVTLGGRPVTIVGVLPPNFRFVLPEAFPSVGRRTPDLKEVEGYVLNPLSAASENRDRPTSIQLVVARLKGGVPLETARTEMNGIQSRIARASKTIFYTDTSLKLIPLQEKLVGAARTALFILLGSVGFVLLIACSNIVSLLLARAASRRKEVAIRAAIGAGTARVFRQFLGENIVLALLGGLAGMLLARLTISTLLHLAPFAVPRLGETDLDWRVFLFALAISLAAGALLGCVPAVSMWRSGLFDQLKQGGKTSAAGSTGLRFRRVLVALEMALAIVLLTGAGLLLKSFWRMTTHPSGFDPEHTLVLRLTPQMLAGRPLAEQQIRLGQLLNQIQSVPGVTAAGAIQTVIRGPILHAGEPLRITPKTPLGSFNVVSSGFGRALGMRLVKGRWLTDAEPAPSVMINEILARRLFGNGDAIGQRIAVPGMDLPPLDSVAAIVGVVGDLKYAQLDVEPEPEVYLPYKQSTILYGALMIRTAGTPSQMVSAVRVILRDFDRSSPPAQLKTLDESLSESVAPHRFNLLLLGTFASAALLLAMVGIYGLIAYSVVQRTHEIGVRAALGAQSREIMRMIVGQGLGICLAGTAGGLVAAFGLTRFMTGVLIDVSPSDPWTFGSVALLLGATALAASWIPALRAARVDPLIALRYE